MKLEKYIIVKAKDQSKLLDATQALANLYAESQFTDEIQVSRVLSENEVYILSFPNQPDFERFKYFVNYLHYPESGGFDGETKGYWTIGKDDGIPQHLVGDRVMLYVSENDTEYDNVFCAFNSIPENYKLGFSSGEEFVQLASSEPPFFESTIESNNLELVKTVVPNSQVVENRNKPKSKGIGCVMVLPLLFIIAVLGIIYVL